MKNNSLKNFLKNFNSIDDAYQKMDMHIHSNWTDGKDSLEDILTYAEMLDLEIIAFTDHIRSESTYFPNYKKSIQQLKKTSSINIFAGFETRIKNFKGELDVKNNDQALADIIVASVHRFSFAELLVPAKKLEKEIAQAVELEICLAGIQKGNFDVLGHAGGMCLKQFGEFPVNYFEIIIKECKANEIAFEINSSYHKNYYGEIRQLLKKYNPLVTFGSDAHDKKDIYPQFDDVNEGRFCS